MQSVTAAVKADSRTEDATANLILVVATATSAETRRAFHANRDLAAKTMEAEDVMNQLTPITAAEGSAETIRAAHAYRNIVRPTI